MFAISSVVTSEEEVRDGSQRCGDQPGECNQGQLCLSHLLFCFLSFYLFSLWAKVQLTSFPLQANGEHQKTIKRQQQQVKVTLKYLLRSALRDFVFAVTWHSQCCQCSEVRIVWSWTMPFMWSARWLKKNRCVTTETTWVTLPDSPRTEFALL